IAAVWCDAQGMEREIVESAPLVWKAGVPLYLEIWPKGIQAHGGMDAFLASLNAHFKSFVMVSEMIKSGPSARPRPLNELKKIAESVGASHDDALVL
ncbi:MAG TPA: hypothetical protein VKX17_24420, partial [Planctomycetota bacterium]|nr:hypothetical protein [Planctomycetota bacterium]